MENNKKSTNNFLIETPFWFIKINLDNINWLNKDMWKKKDKKEREEKVNVEKDYSSNINDIKEKIKRDREEKEKRIEMNKQRISKLEENIKEINLILEDSSLEDTYKEELIWLKSNIAKELKELQ